MSDVSNVITSMKNEECALLQAASPMVQASALLQMFAVIKLAEEMRKVWVHSSSGSQQWMWILHGIMGRRFPEGGC